jgi:hypothetical protein
MNPATETHESVGDAQRREQKDLTDRVGVALVRQEKTGKLKWGTWRRRLGGREEARSESR